MQTHHTDAALPYSVGASNPPEYALSLKSSCRMSNAHDVLYPSLMRTHSLVKYGEYFKYMDDVGETDRLLRRMTDNKML